MFDTSRFLNTHYYQSHQIFCARMSISTKFSAIWLKMWGGESYKMLRGGDFDGLTGHLIWRGLGYHLFNGMPWVILWTLSAAALRTDS